MVVNLKHEPSSKPIALTHIVFNKGCCCYCYNNFLEGHFHTKLPVHSLLYTTWVFIELVISMKVFGLNLRL